MSLRRALAALSLLLAPACGRGALHQATLNAGTAGTGAPTAPLAIGSRFQPQLATEVAGSATPTLHLASASPSVIAVDGGSLVARSAGASAVLVTTDDGAVVDFLHVWAAPVTALTLARRDGEPIRGPIALAVGEDVTLVPALWHAAQRLAGDAEAVWTSSNPAALDVLRDGSPDRRRLRARAPGATTLTVALGEAHTTLAVEVVP